MNSIQSKDMSLLSVTTKEKQSKTSSSSPINIETFKKICGNRTANFFLISNNYNIPKSQPNAAQDIDDVNHHFSNAAVQRKIHS